MNELNFTNKQVLVVGGTSGIGNGIARGFAERGARVQVWGTKPSREDYAGIEGSDISGFSYSAVDLSDPHALEKRDLGYDALDVLVLSQGTVLYKRGEFERMGWDRVVAINLSSLLSCAVKLKEPLMRARGAVIVISSISAFQSNRGNPAYAASKAGAVSLTKTLGEAWAKDGIRVNGIAPGLVNTKLTKVTTENAERLKNALALIPAGRLGTPKDIAGVAAFLASPLAEYIVGQTIVVDGGMLLS